MSSTVKVAKERRHLDRLETLIDSIYALVIVLLVAQFPSPGEFDQEFASFFEFLRTHGKNLAAPLIGLVLVVVYWLQNNALFGLLERTDNKHASISIAQIFFVLFYLYTVDLLDAFPNTKTILAMQSMAFACLGFLAVWGWIYASKDRRLIGDDLDRDDIDSLLSKTLPEPVTALITRPFACVITTAWKLAWRAVPLVSLVIVRGRRRRSG